MSSLLKQNTTSLQELLEEINSLPTYVDTTSATASASDILSGKTAYVDGKKVTGSMANNGAVSKTLDGVTTKSVTIPTGYTSGGAVSMDGTVDNAVTAALSALVEKGVEVPEGTNVTGLAALIEAIEVGGEDILMAMGTITPSEPINELMISHNLGVIPNFIFIFSPGIQSMRTKGAIKDIIVTPQISFGGSYATSFAATTQTQAYYQAFSYYRVNFSNVANGAPSGVSGNPRFTADENTVHLYGTNHSDYSDYSEFIAKTYYWVAVYKPNMTYWSDIL